MSSLRWSAWIYISAVATAAVVLVALGPFAGIDWAQVAALGLLVIICESSVTVLRSRTLTWSAASIVTLAAVVLTGPVGGALVASCTLFSVRRGPSPPQRLFNTAMVGLSAYLAGRAFMLAGGHAGTPRPGSFPGIVGSFAVADATYVLVNFALLGGVLWLTREPGSSGWMDLHVKLIGTDLGYGAFGLLTAAVWMVLGPFAPFLVLVPLLISRWAVAQFVAQQRAYEATVSALCQAVETKDVYTRGHSERVSRNAVMIASEIGMRTERVEALRMAGMLHDVGKLGVPTSVLQKSGKLTDDEYAAIQLHPMRGLDIVREIGFLDEALAGIMHHHERIDGKGYPMGLAGDEIPEFGRVLAVADAFDAMTSTRSYRGAMPICEAIAELRRWAGRQFDPAFVDAFVTAWERDGTQAPAPPPAGDEAAAATAQALIDADAAGSPAASGDAVGLPAVESM